MNRNCSHARLPGRLEQPERGHDISLEMRDWRTLQRFPIHRVVNHRLDPGDKPRDRLRIGRVALAPFSDDVRDVIPPARRPDQARTVWPARCSARAM